MRILFLANSSEALGLAKRLDDEGNTVKVFLRAKTRAGDGIVDKVPSWRTELPDADFVVCGTPGFSQYENVFKKYGKPYIGCSKLGDLLVSGRRGEFLTACGVPECSDKSLTAILHGFFNGRSWLKPLLVSVIDTKLFPGDLGPDVGCVGCTLKVSKRFPSFIEGIGEGLRKLGIKDMVSIPFNSKLEILSVGCGFVYDAVDALCEGIRENLSDLLFRLASGIAEGFEMTLDYVVVGRLTIPPFPYKVPENPKDGVQILGLDSSNLKHVHLGDVFVNGTGSYLACIGSGNTLKVSARGRNLREAQRRMYRTLRNISLNHKQYRIDIGERAEKVFNEYPVKDLVYV